MVNQSCGNHFCCRAYAKDFLPDHKLGEAGGAIPEEALAALCTHVQNAFSDAAPAAAAIEKLRGGAKVARLAALLRSQMFMRRYAEDLQGRSSRLEELAKQW